MFTATTKQMQTLVLPCCLALSRLPQARKLIKRYKDDVKYNTVFAWCAVLLKFLSPGKAGLESVLAAARKQNPHTEAYFTGSKAIPKDFPDSYSLGSREEAICYAKKLQMAWNRHPVALEWLRRQKASAVG